MNWTLMRREWREARWLFIGCAIAMFAFCWMRVWIVGRVDMARFQVVLEQLWDELEKFSPVPLSQILTYTGRVGWAFNEPIMIICMIAWSVTRGSAAVSAKVSSGIMEMLLAQPVSRSHVLSANMLVTCAGVVLLTMVTWLGMYVGIQTTEVKESRMTRIDVPGLAFGIPNPFAPREQFRVPLREKTHIKFFTTACINLGALGLCVAGLTTALSAMDRYRWRTLGLIIGFIVVEMMLRLLATSVASASWVGWFTFFTLYQPETAVMVSQNTPEVTWNLLIQSPVRGASQWGPLAAPLWLVVLAVIGYVIATICFLRRDLPAPL
jgi:ABC-2 type transport system permease protein